MKTHTLALTLLVAILGAACSPADAVVAAASAAAPETGSFQRGHAEWVQQRAAELGKPDGWVSLIGLHWIEPGNQRVGAGKDNAIRLAIGPDRLGQLDQRADGLYFTPAEGARITADGKPLKGEVRLVPEGKGEGTKLGYDQGKGQITAIKRGQRLALRVRHADAPARLGFTGLDFFPADEAWRLKATFVAHPAGKTLPIASVIGEINPTPNPGYVVFEKDGRKWRLEALGDPAKGLSLMFQDQTTGRQTYGVGRYLHTDAVAADGTVTLDFNRAYNPPCAYTDYATCPLPPPENRLAQKGANDQPVRLAVLAGEKKYALAQH